ncbi:MAG: HD domain-containing protein [Coprobacillus cateniformis]
MIDFNAYVDVNMIEKNESLVFNVCQLLDSHHKIKTKEHILAVAQKSQQLAKQFHVNEDICLQSALLHDISVIINPNDMKKMAIENNYLLDKAEEKYPFLLHQMVSQWIAQDIFDIWDERILSAIACHTTLKASPSSYDMILFLADKIAWDRRNTTLSRTH